MTERKPEGENWNSFVERQIREAQAGGEFDHLPGFGQPLTDIDDPYDDMWWLKKKVRRENLSLLPPALQIRLDVQKTLQAVYSLKTESQVRQAIEALNQRIRDANFAVTWGPSTTTMPLEIDRVISEWRCRQDLRLTSKRSLGRA
jgi:hypothetical protein